MNIDTKIEYDMIKDTGNVTITVEGITLDTIKMLIDQVRQATAMNDESLRRAVLKAAYEQRSYGASMKIPLIKAYRMMTGEGLREAKIWVEAHFTEEEMQ